MTGIVPCGPWEEIVLRNEFVMYTEGEEGGSCFCSCQVHGLVIAGLGCVSNFIFVVNDPHKHVLWFAEVLAL